MDKEKLREKLADYAHDAWSRWMTHLFSKCEMDENSNAVIPSEYVSRWRRQMVTEYNKLTHEEKESDRKEADKMIKLFEIHTE